MGPTKEMNEVGSNKAGREEKKERHAQRSGRRGGSLRKREFTIDSIGKVCIART
jgi:hypothetical protein